MSFVITIDFETRSEADLRRCGSSVYARHDSTVLLCLAYHLGGETKLWKPADPPPTDLFDAIHRGDRVEAHNVMFERLIWRHVCHERMGWPDVPESQWRCSMAACSRLGLPRGLGDAAAVLDLSVQKDDEGRRIMLRLSKPLRGGGYDNTPAKLRRLYEYCRTDVDAEIGISRAIPGLPGKELQLWQLDQRINLRGIPIDRAAATRAMALIDEAYAHSCRKIEAITDGAVKTPKQVKVLLEWLNDRGVDADNLRAETVTQLLAGDLPREAREVLTIRQQTALSSTAKLQAMIDRCDDDGRVRGNLVYHGAATGRWAGAGLQIQNFPRGVLSGCEIDALHSLLDLPASDAIDAVDAILATPLAAVSSGLRSMIRAEPGKRLIVGDFASIEARVLAWIAGEQPLIEAFARGQDAYKQMASEIYGVPADEIDKEQRQIGKVAVLGCFAEGTLILTDRGAVPIESVKDSDLLWDGESWVRHEGVICQGVKQTINLAGVRVTPEHEILTEHGWKESWLLSENTELLRSAIDTANSPSHTSITAPAGVSAAFGASALAGHPPQYITTTSCQGKQNGAIDAQRRLALPPGSSELGKKPLCPNLSSAVCGRVGCQQLGLVATTLRTRTTNTTEAAGFGYTLVGRMTPPPSCASYKPCLAGTTRNWSSTEPTTTVTTNRGTSDSSAGPRTLQTPGRATTSSSRGEYGPQLNFGRSSHLNTKDLGPSAEKSAKGYPPSKLSKGKLCAGVRTFDIADAGPRHRYTVLTEQGPIIAHNCGYGMGAFVFQNACRIMGGVDISPRFARQVIKAYRKSNPEIVRLWRGVNKAAISAVRTGSPQIVGRLKLYMQDRWLKIRLPSGRELHYWDPELEEIVAPWSKGSIAFIFGPEDLGPYLEDAGIVLGEREEGGWSECHIPESLGYAGNMIRYKDDPKYIVETYRRREKTPEYIDQITYMTLNSQTRRWERVRSYGGLLVENIVQATARDFLAESMLRVEGKGYPIIASVHDEIVCEVEVGKGSLQEFENLMKQSPVWGKGCPIEVEGFETERYRK